MTNARQLPQPKQQFFKLDGVTPLANGTLTFYVEGTTTLAKVYADATGEARLPNPVRLPSSGAISLWLETDTAHRLLVKDEENNLLWDKQGIYAVQGVKLSSSHIAESSTAPSALPEDAIVNTITSDSGTNINIQGTSSSVSFKNVMLSNDASSQSYTYRFSFPSGYGFADTSGNLIIKFDFDGTNSSAIPEVKLGVSFTSSAGTKSNAYIWEYDLFGNTVSEIKAKGTGHVIIDGYTFPNSVGSAGQKLTTNGSKVLSWS